MADLRVAVVGSFPPRRCGIATFTGHLERSLNAVPGIDARIIVIEPVGESYSYPKQVIGRIRQQDEASYTKAADIASKWKADVMCLQHEYGLWGLWGPDGPERDNIVPLLHAAQAASKSIPVVTTLHTVRPQPQPSEKDVLSGIVRLSAATVGMVRTAAMILVDDYGVSSDRVVRISHGVPVVESRPKAYFKRRLGIEGRKIITTLGLLDPRKGIEYAIRAMSEVVKRHPEALYLIVGETHPETRKRDGEAYRNQLHTLVVELGLQQHITFVNQFLSDRQLVDYLQASDIYVTPYLDRDQITSGTLAFAVGTGKAIISTPYPHATEALAEGRGLLTELRSTESLTHCLFLMLDNPEQRQMWEARTKSYGRQDDWPSVGQRYAELFHRIVEGRSLDDMLAITPEGMPGRDVEAIDPETLQVEDRVSVVEPVLASGAS